MWEDYTAMWTKDTEKLRDGSRIAVIGGGPGGSFSAFFLLQMADQAGLDIALEVFESKDFSLLGSPGCNHCGGVVSESLVQILGAEGMILPQSVVQRGIDAYTFHSGNISLRIETPVHEKRIATVYRGGPKAPKKAPWENFDSYLLGLAREKGAKLIHANVERLWTENGRPMAEAGGKVYGPYDLMVGAVGVNTNGLKLFKEIGFHHEGPKTARAYLAELHLSREGMKDALGDAIHIFFQRIPGLTFGAIIPKGEYATMCLIGHIDDRVVTMFLKSDEIHRLFPLEMGMPTRVCTCHPLMNVGGPSRPFSKRIVLVGDCGMTRLYKDGIGAAYEIAKALATTAVFEGVSERDFRTHFMPACDRMARDNRIGRLCFLAFSLIRNVGFLRRAALSMAGKEQRYPGERREMSMLMWDIFTGSASYKETFLRSVRPRFLFTQFKESVLELFSSPKSDKQ
jgi:flavin-dependent dehydrogenase